MPRRRRYKHYTKEEIRILAFVLPILFIICVGIFFIISFTTWLRSSLRIQSEFPFILAAFAVLALIIGVPIAFIVFYNKEINKKYAGIQIANIDSMTGIEFEQYLKRLLTNQGYSVRVTQASGDLGVDLIASSNNEIIAIQAKRQNARVSRRAISDAVAGKYHYGCTKAMVITNNYFSDGAVTLAHSTTCILIDRDTLAKWVIEFQNTSLEIT